MESALEKAKPVPCEWQISHSKSAGDRDEPDQHYLAVSGILDALDEFRKLEKQLVAKQRSRRVKGKQRTQPETMAL